MNQERIETISNPQVTITCAGDLVIRSTIESSVMVRGDDFRMAVAGSTEQQSKEKEAYSAENGTEYAGEAVKTALADSVDITGSGDLVIQMPRGASVVLLDTVSGDVVVKNIDGTVTANEISGDVSLSTIGGSVTLDSVHGDCAASGIGGDFAINTIHGDLSVSRIDGDTTIGSVHGDFAAKTLGGGLSIEAIMGDMSVRSVTGDLTIENVHGDCSLANLGGINNVHVSDDLRIEGGMAYGKHTFSADSTLTFRWPDIEPITLNAVAPAIRNRIAFDSAEESDGTLNGSIGSDGPVVNLEAGEKITLRGIGESSKQAGFEFDFDAGNWAGFGEMISAEIATKMEAFAEKMNTQFGPEFSARVERQAQRAAEQAMRAAEGAMRKAEQAMRKAEQRAERDAARQERHAQRRPPTPPTPPQAPSKPNVDTKAEQLKILKMLEDGTISLDDANTLLESLG
ncbi:MAG: hypothetical protein M9928_09035 [Anaerolineae bacterium]|nr:hypothetical protein [Anaerolineae bacterium]